MATHDEAIHASLKYFGEDELASDVFVTKYALTDKLGDVKEKTPDEMHHRLAKEFARVEKKYLNPMSEEEIYDLLKDFKYVVPQGSPMSGIGNSYQIQSLSNCFVAKNPEDSYGGICRVDQELVQIMKRRGGVGIDISSLRPKNSSTENASRTSDGIVVFMERFSNSTREVAQGGRRGALMQTISCHHPQIEDFIDAKKNKMNITGANISVRVTDEFLNAVEKGEEVQLRFPVDEKENPSVEKWVDARSLWMRIVSNARNSSEPGILFWDNILKNSPADIYDGFKTISTNPCMSGDTLVAVADGRGFVTFEELALSGEDVPVYSWDERSRKIVIQMMRNPRKTHDDENVFKVTLDDDSSFVCTKEHEILLSSNEYRSVENLKINDSIHVSWKCHAKFGELWNKISKNSQLYSWIHTSDKSSVLCEHRAMWNFHKGKIPHKHVIHHKDKNGLNNELNNLEMMTREKHYDLHSKEMFGKNNAIYRFKNKNPKKFEEFRKLRINYMKDRSKNPTTHMIDQNDKEKILHWKTALSSSKTNINFFEISCEDIINEIRRLTKSNNKRITRQYWRNNKEKKFPNAIPTWMLEQLNVKSFTQLTLNVARELNVSTNSRKEIYTCKICDRKFLPEKKSYRFCSLSCAWKYMHRQIKEIKKNQIIAYQFLYNFSENHCVTENSWKEYCINESISIRFGRQYFKNFKELISHASKNNHKIVSIENIGHQPVFNGTVDGTHNFYIAGNESSSTSGNYQRVMFNTHNCGEIPLCEYDSCRLLLINLSSFVKNSFSHSAEFDFSYFSHVAQKAQRLMDDLVDLEIESIDKILDKIRKDPESDDIKKVEIELWHKILRQAEKGRRTGLGITALGDCLAFLGLKYGSDESIEMTEKIYKCLAINAYKSSAIMARERGSFPSFDHEKEKDHPFLERIMNSDEDLKKLHEEHGRRNISLLTTSPAGTVSTLTRTTSGIEPVYSLRYKRRRKIARDSINRVDFVDPSGDAWQEYDVIHPGLKKWMDDTGETDEKRSPYWGATADKIDWKNRVRLQASAQRWICHSISSTCNLPEDVSAETVDEIYREAWKSGCKGFTVYRQNSRTGVLLEKESEEKNVAEQERNGKFKIHHAPKRPVELPCDVYHTIVGGEKWVILVGLYDGKYPYEIFGGKAERISIPKRHKKGAIIKKVRKTMPSIYDLRLGEGDDELILRDIISLFDNANHAAFTRTISLAMRHGCGIHFVVDQLTKDTDADFYSFSKAAARCLKSYILDGIKTTSEKSCPNCKNDDLRFQEGCVSCSKCGWSRC